MLSNAPTLTPAQVATQLVATATKGTLIGLPTGTTNTLLYQQPASANSFSLSAEVESTETVTDFTADDSSVVVYEEDPGVPLPPTTTLPPKANNVVTPSPVASSPQPKSAMTNVSIGKITKVGKQLRVVVNAPMGSEVSLYRNGKLVGKGVKKFFMVPISKVKKQSFTAVITVDGAFVSSASVSLR
jgi:hypothetical protein